MAGLKCSLILSLVTVIYAENTELFPIGKCCWKGMQLRHDLKSCTNVSGHQVSYAPYAILRAPYNKSEINSWIPSTFDSKSLAIFFNTLDSEMDLIVGETEDSLIVPHSLKSQINQSMVDSTSICYDILQSSRQRVELKRVRLRPIHKCCPEREKFNLNFRVCETLHTKEQDTEEKVQLYSESPTWLPGNFSNQYLKIRYNVLKDMGVVEYLMRADSLRWEIASSPPSTRTVIRFWGKTLSGKNVSGVTRRFCFDEAVEGPAVSQFLLASVQTFVAWKCCAIGMQFDFVKATCVPINLFTVNTDVERQNRSVFDWIPLEFAPLRYFQWKSERISTTTLLYDIVLYKESLEILNLKHPIREQGLVYKQLDDVCYETIENPIGARLILHLYETKPIFKCCGIGERLTSRAERCERIPEFASLDPESYWHKYSYLSRWLPEDMLILYFHPQFHAFITMQMNGYPFNIKVPVNSQFKFKYIHSSSNSSILSFQGRDVFNNSVSSVTDMFCFDEVVNGPLAPKVLLAVKYNVIKCCPRNKTLNSLFHMCLPLQSENKIVYTHSESATQRDESHWMPDSLRHKKLSVLYGGHVKYLKMLTFAMLSNDSLWRLDDSTSFIPTLILNLSSLTGRPFELRTRIYCFDYLSNLKKTLLFTVPRYGYIFNKCCYPGEIFSARSTCEKYDGKDWSPGLSKYSSIFPNDSSREITKFPFKALNVSTKFSVQYPPHLNPNVEYTSIAREIGKYATTIYCMDFQRTADGELREVMGSLTNPAFAWEYERLRPVGVTVALVGVGVAAVVATARSDTRSTVHGRALIAHALSLAIAHALQLAGFINDHIDNLNCFKYAYSTYFFMMASNWWLTAITFNIFRNFRKPLGALSPAASGGRSDSWKRFAAMSIFAWGGAVVTTAIAVGVRESARGNTLLKNGVLPTFTETRTCLFSLAMYILNGELRYIENPFGALCYYYAPSAALTVANVVFVVLTARGLRKLSRGTSILRREAKKNTTDCFPRKHVQQSLMYAKLLLTTGVLEVAVEGAAWSAARLTGDKAFKMPEVTLYLFPLVATGVDVLRAAALLWLCVGPACGAAAGRARGWLALAWRRARPRVTPGEEARTAGRTAGRTAARADNGDGDVPMQDLPRRTGG